jgi:hypothetical protein
MRREDRKPGGRGPWPGNPDLPRTCPACHGCPVRQDRLMCRRCWRHVPRAMRAAVWRTWRSGSGAGSTAHIVALMVAVGTVSQKRAAAIDEARRQDTAMQETGAA